MVDARFFQTTRGKIVTALRRRRGASAVDLADEFGLSPNAVRQQLVFLERDGFVAERSVRRGPTKPTLEYSLTPAAASLFPQQYDRMLNAVLREVRATYGASAVRAVFARMSDRATAKLKRRSTGKDVRGRVEDLAGMLRENGVDTEVIEITGGYELREHNCPYAKTVAEHPEVCSVIHHVMGQNFPGKPTQVESLATGGAACRFEIQRGAESS